MPLLILNFNISKSCVKKLINLTQLNVCNGKHNMIKPTNNKGLIKKTAAKVTILKRQLVSIHFVREYIVAGMNSPGYTVK
jgi:hypothetical protein